MKRRSDPPSQEADAAAGDTPGTDPGILQFGTSVELNNALRRDLEEEIRGMNQSYGKSTKEIEAEEKIHQEILKGLQHALSESTGLHQGSNETLEGWKMNGQIRADLENTTKRELLNPLKPADPSNGEGALNNDGMDTDAPIDLRAKTIAANSEEVQTMTSTKKEELKKFRDMMEQKKAAEEETASILATIEAERLEERLAEAQANFKAMQASLEEEKKRKKRLQASLAATKNRVEETKHREDEEIKSLQASNKDLVSKHAELKRRRDAVQEEEGQQKKQLAELKTQLASVNQEKSRMEADIEYHKEISEKRETERNEREKVRAERNKLFNEQSELGAKVTAWKQELDSATRDCLEAEKLAEAAKAMKLDNDKYDAEVLVGARAELADLQKEKAKLEAFIAEPPESSEKEKQLGTLREEEEALAAVLKELSVVNGEIETKVGENAEIKRSWERRKADRNEEIAAQEAELEELEGATDALQKQIDDLKDKSKSAGERKDDCMEKRGEVDRKFQIYEHGLDLLRKTAKEEERVKEEQQAQVDQGRKEQAQEVDQGQKE